MALHGAVKVNGRAVAVWDAVRTSGGTEPDDINTYHWTVHTGSGYLDYLSAGDLEHRYGDGAIVLASKVLAAVGGD